MPRKAIFEKGVVRMTLRLPPDVYQWVRKKAEEENIEISRVIRKCIYKAMREEKQNESE